MRILGQVGLVFAFGYAGELAAKALPYGLPASVLGLLFMLAALRLGLLRPERLGETAAFFGANMGFFFVAPGVGILKSFDVVRPVLPQVVLVGAVSTVATFLSAYGVARLVQRRLGRK